MTNTSKSPTDTYPMRTLSVSEVVQSASMSDPVTVLACWLMSPSDVDTYACWVVLCHLPHNAYHPFAVWDAIDHPDRGWSFSCGNYCATLDEATTRYEARGGHYKLA